MLNKKLISDVDFAHSCYFRTTTIKPYKKALLQITEKCNLSCAHCFLSAKKDGDELSLKDIKERIVPLFLSTKVISVTLTGGEPMIHPEIDEIVKIFSKNDIKITICSNATNITEEQLNLYKELKNVTFNVSLDGFSENSHGKFRGNKDSFHITKENIQKLAKKGILKGLLVTPNNLAHIDEYTEICNFAASLKIKYVLMNPLSNFGRGVSSEKKLKANNEMMNTIYNNTKHLKNNIDIVNIRFPNNEKKPLSGCEAGNIYYIFSNGDLTICPYLVFASNNSDSLYDKSEFIVGNIYTDKCKDLLLNFNYSKLSPEKNNCINCNKKINCKKGCPANIIANGKKLNSTDILCCNE